MNGITRRLGRSYNKRWFSGDRKPVCFKANERRRAEKILLNLLLCADFLRFYRDCLCATILELLHAPGGVDELLFAGIERVAFGADFNANLGPGCPDGERVAAGANDFCVCKILGMDVGFHDGSIIAEWGPKVKKPLAFLCF